jgi:hypothetical protein
MGIKIGERVKILEVGVMDLYFRNIETLGNITK